MNNIECHLLKTEKQRMGRGFYLLEELIKWLAHSHCKILFLIECHEAELGIFTCGGIDAQVIEQYYTQLSQLLFLHCVR